MFFPYFMSCLSCSPSPPAFLKAQVRVRTRDGGDLRLPSTQETFVFLICSPGFPLSHHSKSQGFIMRNCGYGFLGEDSALMILINRRLPQLTQVSLVHFDALYFS